MQIILFDDHLRLCLAPLSLTRPIAHLRIGLFTQAESWSQLMGSPAHALTGPELQPYFNVPEVANDQVFINARLLPFSAFRQDVNELSSGEAYLFEGTVMAVRCNADAARHWLQAGRIPEGLREIDYSDQMTSRRSGGTIDERDAPVFINAVTDLFSLNERALLEDFRWSTHGRVSAPVDPTCIVLGDPGAVFLEPTALAEGCFLNTRKGPVYIGEGAHVMEGAVIHGPVAIMEGAVVRAGARIYGATTIGPYAKVAGEVTNSVIFGYSNKAHDGFIGNAVIGEWCNLGADTNCSNLKNNYSEVKLWSYQTGAFEATGLTFCGLIMGDHSKCGINTMFNTGTVVGVSANLYGAGFPPKHIPSFSWGGADGLVPYDPDRAISTARKVMARRGIELSSAQEAMLRSLASLRQQTA